MICDQAAGFNRCLFKVQQGMQQKLKAIQTECKGKSASKVAMASDKLQYLMDFNASISQAMAKTMEHLSDFVFVSIANLTLLRRDSYQPHMRSGIKPDTLAALRTAPLQLATLFPDSVLRKAEEDISSYESKGQSGSSYRKGLYHPYECSEKRSDNKRSDQPAWKNISTHKEKRTKGKHSYYSSRPSKTQQSHN